jgi:hypothetical protein
MRNRRMGATSILSFEDLKHFLVGYHNIYSHLT